MRVELARPAGRIVYDEPLEIVTIDRLEQTAPAFARLDAALGRGHHLAGYLTYELGAAFGGVTAPRDALPLARFGIYATATQQAAPSGAPVASALDPPVATWSRARYDAALDRIATSLHAGDAYQINLTMPFAVRYEGEPRALFDALAARACVPYAALIEDGEAALVSMSPELFLAFDGDRIETRPMKGTAPPGDAAALASEKNRAEHVMIVDLLRNDLSRVCDAVDVERMFAVERYPTYATTTSTIAGRLRRGAGLYEIFAATFPCGSVTGAPKLAAMRAIAELEGEPRGIAMGAIGALGPGRRGAFSVAIRTLTLDRRSQCGTVRIGGGIVADSNASDEWAEIFVKRRIFDVAERRVDLYETVRAGAPDSEVAEHLARLCDSADRFGIVYDRDDLEAAFRRAAECRPSVPTLARIALRTDGAIVTTHRELEEPAPQPSVVVVAARVLASDPLLRYKTSRRARYDDAAAEARRRGAFDGLLRNERDDVADGARTTLFIRRAAGAPLATPSLACGALAGILRARLLATGAAIESRISIDDLRTAETLYVGNAARGLLEVTLRD